jgi:hypothetical protein
MLVVAGAGDPRSAASYEIDTPNATARTNGPGEYRVAVETTDDTELVVYRGQASLETDRGSMPVRAGERSLARLDEFPSAPQRYNSARFDAFDEWAAAQRNARVGTTSAQYLPPNLQMYSSTFDQYGSWQYAAPYGYVWYPTVASGWRPYYNGYWTPIRPYGWTWVGVDLWAWPTHHYGRWGFGRGSWFWIPARTWGPAWVSWGAAPGYVSWCPLGFDNRPVFGFANGFIDPWAGWVVVPRTSFGVRGYYVNRHAIQPRDLPRTIPFVVQSAPPVAVPRHAGLSAAAARIAVPRAPAVASRQSPASAPAPSRRWPSPGSRARLDSQEVCPAWEPHGRASTTHGPRRRRRCIACHARLKLSVLATARRCPHRNHRLLPNRHDRQSFRRWSPARRAPPASLCRESSPHPPSCRARCRRRPSRRTPPLRRRPPAPPRLRPPRAAPAARAAERRERVRI